MKTSDIGYVFDIKRFATHDGAGIRTTIFLKGCPLHCVWCQNPEGLKIKPQVLYMKNKCMHCGICANLSRQKGVQQNMGNIILRREEEEDWETIVEECPTKAMCFDAKTYSVEEIMQEAIKDIVFFRYGGGITLSGGEPLLQHEFALHILKECKKQGIHTTIETSAYVDTSVLEEVYPYIDHFYVDLKVFDNGLHKAYTGVGNDKIKKNITYLLESDKRDEVIIRTPMIPKMSARIENVAQIAEFLTSIYADVRYEILNYNPLAKAKYEYLDMEYCFDDNPKLFTALEMDVFYEEAKAHGVKHLIIE